MHSNYPRINYEIEAEAENEKERERDEEKANGNRQNTMLEQHNGNGTVAGPERRVNKQ